jgi:hypothetical protein
MVVKIFWQEKCARCPPAKELGENLQIKGHQVMFCNVKDTQGWKEAIYHDVLSTPSVVVCDSCNNEIAAWRSTTPSINEVLKHL